MLIAPAHDMQVSPHETPWEEGITGEKVRIDSRLRRTASACEFVARRAQAKPLLEEAAAVQMDWERQWYQRRQAAAQAAMLWALRCCQHVQTHVDSPRVAGPAAAEQPRAS